LVEAQRADSRHVEVPAGQISFDPKAPHEPISLVGNGISAVIQGASPITVQVKLDDKERKIDLPADVNQVRSAKLYGTQKLIVAGMFNGDVSKVVVIDIGKAAVSDSFLCYSPEISPDGRFVVFVKFYPAHGIMSAEDHYMIYDVEKSADGNRPLNQSPHPAVVGKVLFPPGVGNVASDNVDIDGPVHTMVSEKFFWGDDSRTVGFAEVFNGNYTLVVARNLPDLNGVLSTPISADTICPAGAQPCFERLFSLVYHEQGVTAEFRGFNGTPLHPVQLEIHWDQFGTVSREDRR
ncbi:MAG TPA: hypothetical protein VGE93_19735, partial [Bryobacteraceae bacterium]